MIKDFSKFIVWANTQSLGMIKQTNNEQALRIMCHALAAEHIWADRILGQTAVLELFPTLSITQCEALIETNAKRYGEILSLNEGLVIEYSNTKGEKFTSQLSDIVLHVFAHGAYHRGQISILIRESGSEVIDTDYIFYTRSH